MPLMTISYPLSNATVPTLFTAWGTFDYADAEQASGNNPAKCTLTPAQGPALVSDISLVRDDGVWTAIMSGLTPNTLYTIDAFYTRKNAGGQQNAVQEDTILASMMPVPVVDPPMYNPRPVLLAAQAGPPVAGAGVGVAVAPVFPAGAPGSCCHPHMISRHGTYPFPTCARVHKAQAIVRRRRNNPGGPVLPVPGSYISVHPVLTAFGSWTTLIPLPADAAPGGPQYVADIVFLDRDGRLVVTPLTVAVH